MNGVYFMSFLFVFCAAAVFITFGGSTPFSKKNRSNRKLEVVDIGFKSVGSSEGSGSITFSARVPKATVGKYRELYFAVAPKKVIEHCKKKSLQGMINGGYGKFVLTENAYTDKNNIYYSFDGESYVYRVVLSDIKNDADNADCDLSTVVMYIALMGRRKNGKSVELIHIEDRYTDIIERSINYVN